VLLTRQSPNQYENRPFSVTLPGRITAVLLVCELVYSGSECCESVNTLPTHTNRLICYADVGTLARVSEDFFTGSSRLQFEHIPASFLLLLEVQFLH